MGRMTSLAADTVTGLRVLRGAGASARSTTGTEPPRRRRRPTGIRLAAPLGIIDGIQVLIPGCFIVALTWIGATLVATGDLTPGQLVSFYGYAGFLVMPIQVAADAVSTFTRAQVGAGRVLGVLAVDPLTADPSEPDDRRRRCPTTSPTARADATIRSGSFVALAGDDAASTNALLDRLARLDDTSPGCRWRAARRHPARGAAGRPRCGAHRARGCRPVPVRRIAALRDRPVRQPTATIAAAEAIHTASPMTSSMPCRKARNADRRARPTDLRRAAAASRPCSCARHRPGVAAARDPDLRGRQPHRGDHRESPPASTRRAEHGGRDHESPVARRSRRSARAAQRRGGGSRRPSRPPRARSRSTARSCAARKPTHERPRGAHQRGPPAGGAPRARTCASCST